jgi:hypothetical protein
MPASLGHKRKSLLVDDTPDCAEASTELGRTQSALKGTEAIAHCQFNSIAFHRMSKKGGDESEIAAHLKQSQGQTRTRLCPGRAPWGPFQHLYQTPDCRRRGGTW